MISMEKLSGERREEERTDPLSAQVYALMKDFPSGKCSKEELREGERILDERMEKMSREELINLAIDIRQRLEQPQSGFVDENMHVRFSAVYGAACAQLEKMEGDA